MLPARTAVLVVDDDEAICESLRYILEDADYTVNEVSDGLAAWQRLQESPERLVVLLDWRMPRMDGQRVMELVAAHPALATRHAYIIITAIHRTLPLPFLNLLHDLHVPVVTKPFEIDDLLATVAQASERLSGESAAM